MRPNTLSKLHTHFRNFIHVTWKCWKPHLRPSPPPSPPPPQQPNIFLNLKKIKRNVSGRVKWTEGRKIWLSCWRRRKRRRRRRSRRAVKTVLLVLQLSFFGAFFGALYRRAIRKKNKKKVAWRDPHLFPFCLYLFIKRKRRKRKRNRGREDKKVRKKYRLCRGHLTKIKCTPLTSTYIWSQYIVRKVIM